MRGLAKGMGSTDSVHSPSFTLSNQYKAGDKTLFHFDFYRLQEPGIMLDEISEVITDPQAIVAVEWANIVENVLPAEHITVTIHAIDDNARELTISYPQSLEYAFEDVT